jgi:PEP-CTERM motif-containing protein
MKKHRYFFDRTTTACAVKRIARSGLLAAALLVTALLVGVPSAQAISYNLTSDHCTGGCGPAGTIFGVVTLTQNGTTVDVTVHLNSPYEFANTGAADNQAFKFNAVGVVLGDITVDAHTPSLIADTGAFNGDGTGQFSFGISCPSCGPGLSDPFSTDIVFHVANATIAELTVPNNLGNIFVADVGNPNTGNTGPVDASTPNTNVPEPASAILLGLGLFGIRFLALRRKTV